MTRLTDDALAELARLAGEATPAPWRTVVKGNTVQSLAIEGVCSGISPKTGNGPYIAAADPSTVAALVAELVELRNAMRSTSSATIDDASVGMTHSPARPGEGAEE